MSSLQVDNIQTYTSNPPVIKNSSGTEVGTFCRAWVNFNGTGTVAIRASFNVSSITDNGTGDYTVNFTTALADANYTAVAAGSGDISGGSNPRQGPNTSDTRSASSIRIRTGLDSTVLADWYAIDVAIFR